MNTEIYDRMVRAQEEFHDRAMAIPGVHGTSIGKKRVAGQPTEEFAIVVHLDSKKVIEEVQEDERIPEQVGGFPTDVIEHGPPQPLVDDLEGGANLRVGGYYGTLGCIVRDTTDSTTCLLSNQHVLDQKGTAVYVEKNDACHRIGTTKLTVNNGTVDAGISSIDKGIRSKAAIDQIGDVAGTKTLTWRDAGLAVRKTGRSSGLTYGTVSGTNFRGMDALGNPTQAQIYIEPNAAKNKEFAAPGDSGSVIVDDDNFVVALLWAKARNGEQAFANRIENVTAALGITVLTPQTADAPLPHSQTFGGQLEALCAQSARGQAYYQTYLAHRDEVQHLFHENARLYATWRSVPQEAFMEAFREAVRDPDGTIPATLDGQDTTGVLRQLRDALGGYTQDAGLTRGMDELIGDLADNIGATWQQAIAGGDGASRPTEARPTAGA